MRKKKDNPRSERSGGLVQFYAGEFSEWLRRTEAGLRSGTSTAEVPCGSCTACCRSSMFIHIQPDEAETLRRIPRELLFPAPGWPKGHVLMGYTGEGHCPMLVNDQCSIYEHRPRTCRSYDCRVLAATGICADPRTQADIAERAKAWGFQYADDESRKEQQLVKAAAEFLEKNRDLFPQGSLPNQPARLAALAIRVFRLIAELNGHSSDAAAVKRDAEIARAILASMESKGQGLVQCVIAGHEPGACPTG